MKHLVILSIWLLSIFGTSLQASQYLTESQKKLLLQNSALLGQVKEQVNAQSENESNQQIKAISQQSAPLEVPETNPGYFGGPSYRPTSHRVFVYRIPQPQTQSLHLMISNMDWGTPSYSNRTVQQNQRLATRSDRIAWSNFFSNVSLVADQVNSGLNQANSQSHSYIQQPYAPSISAFSNGNPAIESSNNQIHNTYNVGSHTFGVGGSRDVHTYDVGNQTHGYMGDQQIRKVNFEGMSLMTTGEHRLVCRQAGGMKICN
jgi:hypothetical protein